MKTFLQTTPSFTNVPIITHHNETTYSNSVPKLLYAFLRHQQQKKTKKRVQKNVIRKTNLVERERVQNRLIVVRRLLRDKKITKINKTNESLLLLKPNNFHSKQCFI